MLYGYDTGIISGALLQISREFHIGNGMKQVIAAGILLGAVIGALTCSVLSERIGRHRTILLICTVFILGSVPARSPLRRSPWPCAGCCSASPSAARPRPCPCTWQCWPPRGSVGA
ncbi:MFS transporter [Streptomyces sp. NPDC001222]|uniref:MFS transporter n=1 Tax=Streptomyces sp. NPDC001222 TaxID=3364548 RepID=UPI0036A1F9CF